jgi:Holliday junction resolvase RusA-like endonuclease
MKLHVVALPPYKQTCASLQEKQNQLKRTETLRQAAQEQKQAIIIKDAKVRLSITYYRSNGRSDASNIIGGISDALNGLAYTDDRQINEIHYKEEKGVLDEYIVIVEQN